MIDAMQILVGWLVDIVVKLNAVSPSHSLVNLQHFHKEKLYKDKETGCGICTTECYNLWESDEIKHLNTFHALLSNL